MSNGPLFRANVLAARERLAQGRAAARKQHDAGRSGAAVCVRLTDLYDSILRDLWNDALQDLKLEPLRERMALIPVGGYGRREIAPGSDLDIMFLHAHVGEGDLTALVGRILQDLYDTGLSPGYSVRTLGDTVQYARNDATIYTALVEARFLSGNQSLYTDLRERFERLSVRRFRSLYDAIMKARSEEEAQFGDTNYLLQPNIKRSRGGLRDIQLLRWMGFARFGTPDPDALWRQKALSKFDRHQLVSAREFLLSARNDLHFQAGKSQDLLTRAEQVRLAEKRGYRGRDGMLPVEEFMREYFRRTQQIRNLVSRFVETLRPAPTVAQMLNPVFAHLVERDYRVGWNRITATTSGLQKLRTNLDEVLRLADLANLYNKRIDHGTWSAVCRAAPNYPAEISDQVIARFLSLLARPARLSELLRRLHELGVLEKIIPAFRHARGLLQFNEYHKYTVDEHSLRAIDHVVAWVDDDSSLGEVYHSIRNKRVLHLALLLHDLGKGWPEDHSIRGERIAEETCQRLRLPSAESETVRFLVRHHLLMSHTAFRRDLSDPQLIVRLAVQVGSPEAWQMLYVMTCADLSAVGPGVLNSWKLEVLTELYQRVMQHFGEGVLVGSSRWVARQRRRVEEALPQELQGDWAEAQIAGLPTSYLQYHAPDSVCEMLARLRKLQPREGVAWAEYLEESNTTIYTVLVDRGHGRGIFSKLAGALTSQGLEVLSAEIYSLAGEAILDRFVVHDRRHEDTPPQERLDEVAERLIQSLDTEEPPRFQKLWQGEPKRSPADLSELTTRVHLDNGTSEAHTIVDVFTFDRPGLLYAIARTLLEQQLSIAAARISTHVDQVVDVFYVTDQRTGRKIEDPDRQEAIRQALLEAIQATEQVS